MDSSIDERMTADGFSIEDQAEHEAEVRRAMDAPGRLHRTVHLGEIGDPAALFGGAPNPKRLRMAFRSGCAEALERLKEAGLEVPGQLCEEETFTGQKYDDQNNPAPEYRAWWERFYRRGDVEQARQLVREQRIEAAIEETKHRADQAILDRQSISRTGTPT